MWHELVLNGVGGQTIEQAKRNLTPDEASRWFQYVNQFGSLNINRSLDRGFAMLASLIDLKTGGNRGMEDFMRHYEDPDEVISLEQAMEDWA